jgi:hypothetical protein
LWPKPGFLADPDFTLTLGAGGTITGVKTVLSEQFTPTIKAIGSFAANLVALGVFDESAGIGATLSSDLKRQECAGRSESQHLDPVTLKVAQQTVEEELKRRLAALGKDETILARFHYADQAERACLAAIRDAAVAGQNADIASAKTGWTSADASYASGDKEYLKKIKGIVEKNDQAWFKQEQTDLEGLKVTAPQLYQKRFALVTAAAAYMAAQAPRPYVTALKTSVDMDAATWRARHLLYLEDEITSARLALLRQPTATLAVRQGAEQVVARLNRIRAETIDAQDLYARAQSLGAFLESVRTKGTDHGTTAPATAEYATARAELDLVNERIESLRTKVIAAAKPAAPPAIQPLKDEPLTQVTQAIVDASQRQGWSGKIDVHGVQVDAPKFVIVLE